MSISGRSEERQKPIHLEDVTIECASVIELVFDMLYHSKDICTFNLYASLNVVKFLSKYEFKPKLELVRLQLRSRLLDTADAPWVFVRACELGDHELCGDVIKCGSPKPWADNVGSSGKFGTAIPGVWSLDPTAFSQTFFEYMSPQCMWALCRAFRKIPQTGDTSAASRKLMANGFVRLMKLRGTHSYHD